LFFTIEVVLIGLQLTRRYCRWWGIRIPSARNNCWL